MSQFSRFALVLTLVVAAGFMTGCAKSNEQKSQETKASVESAIADFKTTAEGLDTMGTPSAHWSSADLDKYEGMLSALENHMQRIEAANGKDDVIVFGTYNFPEVRKAIVHNRDLVQAARAEQVRLQANSQADAEESARKEIEESK